LEAVLRLSLDTREVGHVTIVRCNGRITAGSECDTLRTHVTWLLRDRRAIVLHLGEVVFIDSCGLGTIVRSLTSTRQAHGDLKLCNISENVRKILEMSHLATVFDTHESEEKAIAAFYGPRVKVVSPARSGRSILCVERNADVLSYLRAMLHRAGYEVQSTSHLGDALMLLRVTRFDLVLTGPDCASGTHQAFHSACASLPVVELSRDFSTLDAGEAAASVLQQIQSRLNPASA
jgi:anti-sigma B factor antagonist